MSAERAREAATKILETLPAIMQSIMAELRRCETPMPMPHFRALHILAHHCHTLSDLAEMTKVSLPTMSNTVSVLVDRGWAERVADLEDRRKAEVRVTDAGREVLAATEAQILELVGERLTELPDEEVEALITALDIMRRGLDARQVPLHGKAEPA